MNTNRHALYDSVKRCLDIIAAILALIITAPVLLLSAFIIMLDGGPVFFTQIRVGRNGRFFQVYKLRTMIPDAHEMELDLRHLHASNGGYGTASKFTDHRITKIGSLLRLTNMDELPQFINILKGEMSLIGPRPVPYEESLFYGNNRCDVQSVRPGLTGYWQIKRRMSTGYDERIELDCYYVEHRSLLLDAYILLMTPISMLTSDYNSVTKPLPPLDGTILISDRARVVPKSAHLMAQEESIEDAVV